jgi:hypothetical protein
VGSLGRGVKYAREGTKISKDRLESLVGSKFDRAQTLAGIGAELAIYSTFRDQKNLEWQSDVILSMYPKRTRMNRL